MSAAAIRQVSVWLDDGAPQEGAFGHALDWASRLGLPLRAVVASEDKLRVIASDGAGSPIKKTLADLLPACARACGQSNVPWDYSLWQGPVSAGVQQFLRTSSLCVFSSALTTGVKAELLRESLRGIELPVLVCRQTWQPSSRLLVLHQANDSSVEFLNIVACLCDRLRVTPVVLTVAQNDREGRVQQQAARTVWATRGLNADFDMLLGCDVRTAVVSVARWRRCTHILVDHQRTSPWWRWLRGDTLAHFLGLNDSFSILALPTLELPVVHPEPVATTMRAPSRVSAS